MRTANAIMRTLTKGGSDRSFSPCRAAGPADPDATSLMVGHTEAQQARARRAVCRRTRQGEVYRARDAKLGRDVALARERLCDLRLHTSRLGSSG